MSVATARELLPLMEASGTDVFFRFTTADGKSDKTDTMSPAAAVSFLDVSEALGVTFTRIVMDRAERW